MNKIIGIELKRDMTKTALIIMIFFILSVLFLNYSGLQKSERLEDTKKEFIKNESQKVERYPSYRQYGGTGFKLLFLPPPIAFIFNTTSLNNLQSINDFSFGLDVYQPQKGKYMFKRGIDLFRYLLVVGGCIFFIFGWFSYRNRKYLRFLLNSASRFVVYLSIFIARTILVFLSILILTVFIIAHYYIMGVNLNGSEIAIIKVMLVTFGMVFFFFLLGTALGNINNAKKSGVRAFIIGLVLLFLWPNFFNLKFYDRADSNISSIYDLENKKLKILSEFEKQIADYVKDKENKIKATKEFSLKFLNDGVVERLEFDLIKETENNIKKIHLWSIINPATFYESVVNEICGNGFNEQQRFFRESVIKKRKFSKYIVEQMFQQQTGKVEPFLSGDEYIFYAKPGLPYYFTHGVLLTLFYIVALFIVSYSGFKKYVSNVPKEKIPHSEKFEIKLDKGKLSSCITSVAEIKELIYNYLSGNKKALAGKIIFSGNEIDENNIKTDLYYIAHPNFIPGTIKVKCLFNFLARSFNMTDEETKQAYNKLNIKSSSKKNFSDLAYPDKINLLVFPVEVKKIKIVLFNEIERDQTEDDYNFLFERMKELKKDRFLLYMTKNLYIGSNICDEGKVFIPKQGVPAHLMQ